MKWPAVIVLTCLGLMIAGAIIGGFLESSGAVSREALGARGIALIILGYFMLFCVMAFALVPLLVRAFLAMQVKAGNGEKPVIRWLRAHAQSVIHGFWILFIAGLIIAVALAINEVLALLQ